jgi:hypothetical protein
MKSVDRKWILFTYQFRPYLINKTGNVSPSSLLLYCTIKSKNFVHCCLIIFVCNFWIKLSSTIIQWVVNVITILGYFLLSLVKILALKINDYFFYNWYISFKNLLRKNIYKYYSIDPRVVFHFSCVSI